MGNKLLVAVDGSANAIRAVEYSIRLAKKLDGMSIHLVTAHEEPRMYGEIAVYVTPEKMAELQRLSAEAALAEAEKLIREAAVPYTREILTGAIAVVIAARADELDCEGIVIGTRGMGAFGNLLLGSISTRIVHFAHVPVTLVK